MECVKMTITPAMAKDWLDTMEKNRKLNSERVSSYSNDIQNGRWTESVDLIGFNTSGRLCNGQHRLRAIIKSGVSIEAWVAFDVPENAVIDKGRPRSTGDSLYMRGITSKEAANNVVAAIVKMYREIAYSKHSHTDDEIAELINEYEEELLETVRICKKGRSDAICRKTPVQTAVFGALLAGVNRDVLYEFCEAVNTGFTPRGLCQSSAIVLRNYMLSVETNRDKTTRRQLETMTEMAIKDFVNSVPRKIKYRVLQQVYIFRKEEN